MDNEINENMNTAKILILESLGTTGRRNKINVITSVISSIKFRLPSHTPLAPLKGRTQPTEGKHTSLGARGKCGKATLQS